MHKFLVKFKDIIVILACLAIDIIIYSGSKLFINKPQLIGNSFDKATPFLLGFVWVYVSWYLALVLIPYYISRKNRSSFFKYLTTFLISVAMCGIIFLIYPTTIAQPNVEVTNLSSFVLNLVYTVDTPALNCLPSIHCLFSYLFILSIFDCKKEVPTYLKIIITIYSLLVVASTLFIKQHVIYDALASIVVIIISWIVCNAFKLHELFEKKIYNKVLLK